MRAGRSARGRLATLGAVLDYDRSTTAEAPPYTDDQALIVDSWAQLRGEGLFVSWRAHVGPEVIAGVAPPGISATADDFETFASIVIEYQGGTLPEARTVRMDAVAGDGGEIDRELGRALGPGTYEVTVRLEAQYVEPDGRHARIRSSGGTLRVQR